MSSYPEAKGFKSLVDQRNDFATVKPKMLIENNHVPVPYVPTPEELASDTWNYCFSTNGISAEAIAASLYYEKDVAHAHHQ